MVGELKPHFPDVLLAMRGWNRYPYCFHPLDTCADHVDRLSPQPYRGLMKISAPLHLPRHRDCAIVQPRLPTTVGTFGTVVRWAAVGQKMKLPSAHAAKTLNASSFSRTPTHLLRHGCRNPDAGGTADRGSRAASPLRIPAWVCWICTLPYHVCRELRWTWVELNRRRRS